MSKSLIAVGVAATILVTVLSFSAVSGNSLRTDLSEPKTVPYVDIERYAGTWYEQAVIPYYWENGCTKTKAVYSKNADGTIRVDNSCIKNGKSHENVGKAIIQDETHAKLKVQFIQTLDIGAQYWIVRLGEYYEYAVVSSPNYRYLWILSREPHMSQYVYQAIITDLTNDGFAVEKLKRTQQ